MQPSYQTRPPHRYLTAAAVLTSTLALAAAACGNAGDKAEANPAIALAATTTAAQQPPASSSDSPTTVSPSSDASDVPASDGSAGLELSVTATYPAFSYEGALESITIERTPDPSAGQLDVVTIVGTMRLTNTSDVSLNAPPVVWLAYPHPDDLAFENSSQACDGFTTQGNTIRTARDADERMWCMTIGSTPSDGYQVPMQEPRSYPLDASNSGNVSEFGTFAAQVPRSIDTDELAVCLDNTPGGWRCASTSASGFALTLAGQRVNTPSVDIYGEPLLRGYGPLIVAGNIVLRRSTESTATADVAWVDVSNDTQGTASLAVEDGEVAAVLGSTVDDGVGAVTVVSSTTRPASGLTPEQTVTRLTGFDLATERATWTVEYAGSPDAVFACGSVLLTSAEAADTYDLQIVNPVDGGIIASRAGEGYELSDAVCFGRNIMDGNDWISLDTGEERAFTDGYPFRRAVGKYAFTDTQVLDLQLGQIVYDGSGIVGVDPGGTIVIDDYDLTAIDLAAGTERWRLAGDLLGDVGFEFSSVRNGVIYGTTGGTLGSNAELVAISLTDGSELWSGGSFATSDDSDSRQIAGHLVLGGTVIIDHGPERGAVLYREDALLGVENGQPVFG